MEELKNQQCPICNKKTLTLREEEKEIPYFGNCFLFSMNCSSCKYSKSDIESAEDKEPIKLTFTIEKGADLKVRVIKSSNATIKIPQMRMKMEAGPNSEGIITNIEGILNKFEKIIEEQRDTAEDNSIKKTAKNLLKKLWKVKCGDIPLKIIIEDPSGNSAIIDKKTEVVKLK